jgi:hypothetical protein
MITKNGALIFGKGKMTGDNIQITNSLGENVNINVLRSYAPDDWTMSVGSGTTEPTRDDIRLTNGIPGTIVQIGTLTCDVASNGNLIFTRAFTNISDSDVTITELGLYLMDNGNAFFAAHKLIPARTVQPNETVTFSYVVEFN